MLMGKLDSPLGAMLAVWAVLVVWTSSLCVRIAGSLARDSHCVVAWIGAVRNIPKSTSASKKNVLFYSTLGNSQASRTFAFVLGMEFNSKRAHRTPFGVGLRAPISFLCFDLYRASIQVHCDCSLANWPRDTLVCGSVRADFWVHTST